MNKLIIPIIIVAVIAVGIGAYFIFQKPAFPELQLEKCGDGICDEFEKNNSNVCPKDCVQNNQQEQQQQNQQSTQQPTTTSQQPSASQLKSQEQISQDSPFGFFNPYEILISDPEATTHSKINDYLKDLGVKWMQPMPRVKDGISDIDEALKSNVNLYSRALPIGRIERSEKAPYIGPDYEIKLKELVKKYKNEIKYWEADTEPSGVSGWGNYPEKYADFLKITYKAIKEECTDCKIVFGGMVGDFLMISENSKEAKFLDSVLKAGGGKYFDVFEFKQHHNSIKDYPKLIKNKMEIYGRVLAKYSLDIKTMPVFIETAVYDGAPEDPFAKLPSQSEKEQARGEIISYIYAFAQGIDKVFRNQIIENAPNKIVKMSGVFEYYGLINNPSNDGKSHKKLAYYTYKKMTETLEGSDWNNIQTVQESDGVYIYKFQKGSKKIWVAWNDNSASKTITISGITSNQIKITEAVPKYESGKDVTDYLTAFNTETKSVQGGKIIITLKDKPVFAEE